MDVQPSAPHFLRASLISALVLVAAVMALLASPPLWVMVLAVVAALATLILTFGFLAAERQWRRGIDPRVLP